MKSMQLRNVILPLAALALALALAAPALATDLIGFGPNLPIPNPNDPLSYAAPILTVNTPPGGFTGTWVGTPALPDYQGYFTAMGPVPAGQTATGTTTYDFSSYFSGGPVTLHGDQLSIGSFVILSDLDTGSGQNETFTLSAWDPFGTQYGSSQYGWLSPPVSVWGTGSGPQGQVLPTDMPGWSYNGGVYVFDGNTALGDPINVAVGLEITRNLGRIVVERTSTFANMYVVAPVPEPATLSLLGLGAAVLFRRRR